MTGRPPRLARMLARRFTDPDKSEFIVGDLDEEWEEERRRNGGVMLVFLLLCANVASLQLTALSARRQQFGVCSALGASRGRLLRQALVESAILSVLGAVGGVGIAAMLVSVARGFLPEALVRSAPRPSASAPSST